jgi:hypothetical protein
MRNGCGGLTELRGNDDGMTPTLAAMSCCVAKFYRDDVFETIQIKANICAPILRASVTQA